MTYTTTLRGKHRTLTGIGIWIRNRVTRDYIRLTLMRGYGGYCYCCGGGGGCCCCCGCRCGNCIIRARMSACCSRHLGKNVCSSSSLRSSSSKRCREIFVCSASNWFFRRTSSMYMDSNESAAGGLLEPKGRPRFLGVGTGAKADGELPGGCIGPPLLLLVATLMVLLLLLM